MFVVSFKNVRCCPLVEDTVIILFNECELQIMFQNYKILEYVDSYEHIVGVCMC